MTVLDNVSSVRFDYSTGAAAIAETLVRAGRWWLIGIRLHLSGAAAVEDFIVTVASGEAAVHNTVLSTTAMNGLLDLVLTFGDGTTGVLMEDGDSVTIDFANGNNVTWGLELISAGA